ncbi:MAG: helix-turn-helix transcriptional regulator [Spirochaetaceae bacterium]|nr:helix-turn-helix transcriptional regulator [Spirochaetaceae bacterium]
MDFELFKKNFADTLRNLRNSRQISAREMSLSLGQNVNYINYIENGRHLPSMHGFFLICEYLGVDPCDFFILHKKNIAESDEAEMFFRTLSKNQKEAVVSMLKVFKC